MKPLLNLGTRGPVRLLGACVALGCLAAVAGAMQSAPRRPASTGPQVVISGNVTGLVPGVPKMVAVQLRSRSPDRLRVSRITATVARGPAACPTRFLSILPLRGPVRIRPYGRRNVKLRALLAATAPDACQRAVFGLRYTARVVRR